MILKLADKYHKLKDKKENIDLSEVKIFGKSSSVLRVNNEDGKLKIHDHTWIL